MKRPDAKQIRAELERRRLAEAQAVARSDAIADARVAKAFDVLMDGRERDLDDLEARLTASAGRSVVERGPGGAASSR